MIRTTFGFIGGVFIGQLVILASGILTIQAFGVRLGTVFSLNNEIATIVPGSTPYWFLIPTAVLQAIVAYYCFQFSRPSSPAWRITGVLGFGVSLAVTALILLANGAVKSPAFGDALAVLPGWRGWMQYGALNDVTYMLSALSLGLVLLALRRRVLATSTDGDLSASQTELA